MDEDKKKRNVIQLMLGFVRRANGDHVSAYAAQAAYFLIMSFIPFILFLTTLIQLYTIKLQCCPGCNRRIRPGKSSDICAEYCG